MDCLLINCLPPGGSKKSTYPVLLAMRGNFIINVPLSMIWQNHIVSDKQVLLGKPIIKGTRISVELVRRGR